MCPQNCKWDTELSLSWYDIMNKKTFQAHELPSRGIGLPVSEVTVSNFTLNELILLERAQSENDYNYAIQAMNATLDCDVNLLSIGDFYYLMSYQRTVCFPNSPISLGWTCGQQVFKDTEGNIYPIDTKFEKDVAVAISSCGTRNFVEYEFDDLLMVQVDSGTELPAGYDFPRVSILAELRQAIQEDPSKEKLLSCVQWINCAPTIAERLVLLQQEETLDKIDMASKLNRDFTHGLLEEIYAECSSCKGKVRKAFRVDITSFFR